MPGIFTQPISENRRLRGMGLNAYSTSLGDTLSAVAEEAWKTNPLPSAWREMQRWQYQPGLDEFGQAAPPQTPSRLLSPEEAQAQYGINGHLKFSEAVPEPVAQELHDLKQEELARADVIARGPSGFTAGAAKLATGFAVGAVDPINLASAFIPVVGPARYALWLERAGGTLGRAGVRLGVGSLEGAVGAAVVEPLVYGVAQREQADYTATDSLLNLAFGTVLGGGLHMGVGHIGDRVAAWRGDVPLSARTVDAEAVQNLAKPGLQADDPYLSQALVSGGLAKPEASQLVQALAGLKPETREALLRASVAQLAEDRPVSVRDLARLDPGLQAEMLDVGRVLDVAVDNPLGGMDQAIARISPDHMEELLFQKGEAFIAQTGELVVQGKEHQARLGREASLGAVKLLVKHGEFSDKAGTPEELTRADVLALPRVVREFQPSDVVRRADTKAIKEMRWEVSRADGTHVRYAVVRSDSGELLTASVHVRGKGKEGPLSAKRTAPATSPRGVNSRDTKAGGIPSTPPEAARAAQSSYTRSRSARQGLSLHQLHTVYDGSGRSVQVRYQLVELADLKASHTPDLAVNPAFPAELQPRDRGRSASEAQIHDIVANFEPERLGASPDSATGAPVVGPDNLVESGNGRVLALSRVHQQGGTNQARYRAFIQKLGFDASLMREPVLIRRRVSELSPEERRAFTVDSQKSGTLDLSVAERASADAHLIDPILHLLDGADVTQARNARFVRAFIDGLPQAEQGRLLDADGNLALSGKRRIEAAILARAFDDADLLGRMLESADDNSRSLVAGLMDAAPDWALMRSQAAQGDISPHVDATNELLAAVRLIRDARAKGVPLAELKSQLDLFAVRPQLVDRFLDVMLKDAGEGRVRTASREHIGRELKHYAGQALESHPTPDLFGKPPVTAEELLGLLSRDQTAGETVSPDADILRAIDELAHEASQPEAHFEEMGLDAELKAAIDSGRIDGGDPDLAEVKEIGEAAKGWKRMLDAGVACLTGRGS